MRPFFYIQLLETAMENSYYSGRKAPWAIFGLVLLLVCAGSVYFLATRSGAPVEQEQEYIFDKTYDVSVEDLAKYHGVAKPGEKSPEDEIQAVNAPVKPEDYFGEDFAVSIFTRKYFKHLEKLFKDSPSLSEHLKHVKEYLYAQAPPEEAEQLFKLYEKYINCEMELAKAKSDWDEPRNTQEVIDMLARIQEFRRDLLGDEAADALFGVDIKTKEYAVRRGSIVRDESLYGQEKEALIAELTDDMWGDQAQEIESHSLPYNRYQEKLKMYELDMSEMETEEEKQELINEFRNQLFEPDIVARLEEVDAIMASEKLAEETYSREKQAIVENPDLSEEEKELAVDELGSEIFGEDLEAHKRREAIETAREAMIKSRSENQPDN